MSGVSSIEMTMEQAKDMQSYSTKAVEDMTAPVKDAFGKTMKELKVA